MASGGEGYGEPPAGDHLQSVYRLWLVGHQLANGAAPWEDPYSFQPLAEPQTVLAGWPFGLVYWPLGALFGPVVAWNLLLLGTIVVAGLLTYLWLRALELGPWAAAIGGLAFAVAPYRLDQSASGHLLGWAAIFLPLALLGIERARVASTPRRAHGWGALTAAALASIAAFGPAPPRARRRPVRARLRARAPPADSPPLDRGGLRRRSGGRPRRPLHADRRVGGGPGALARRRAQVPGRVGRPLQPLAPAAGARSSSTSAGSRPCSPSSDWSFSGVDAVGWPCCSGWGRSSRSSSRSGRTSRRTRLLWHALPPLRFPRVPERFMPIADLALAALLAFAVAELVRRAGRSGMAVAAGLLVLVALDLGTQPVSATAADPDNEAYAALVARADPRAPAFRSRDPLRQGLRLLRAAGASRAPAGLQHARPAERLLLRVHLQPDLVRGLGVRATKPRSSGLA